MKQATGKYIDLEGQKWYLIENYDALKPFFISLASDTDLWMYLSSTGGLTCGRRNPDQALFPYYTDDKITESSEHTGPKTLIRIKTGDKVTVWEPFSEYSRRQFKIQRNIMKSVIGNEILFSEYNECLGLTFSYLWVGTDKYGWIRKATLRNDGENPIDIELIDGLQNVLPAGTNRVTQNTYSCLVDGYKKTELVPGTDLMLFRMEAIMVDRAEPSESLRCNTAFCLGLANTEYLCSSEQLDAFRDGDAIAPETESRGVRGAILAHTTMHLEAGESRMWYFALDAQKDACDVRELISLLKDPRKLYIDMNAHIANATDILRAIVEQNDGVMTSGDPAVDARHFANVLFNTMRGGYYVQERPGDNEDEEYLPLTFGRRHGDPSRPWNIFDIRVKDKDGNPLVAYQGNWRDIFQNWEALSVSYPAYVNRVIARFFNATTIDGYNPYKVTDHGYEWEVINPNDPWSNIGYWGDHQIIYLSKLLELSYDHNPEALLALLNARRYKFANVPYRLKTYAEIVADPKNSILYDEHMYDGINLPEATFTEKILVTLLAKLSNFVPDAGIWMNTLRPEWNDANNALVGNGASMVTLYYIRRFVSFLSKVYSHAPETVFEVSLEINQLMSVIWSALENITDRRQFIDTVGVAGEQYRTAAYRGLSGERATFTNEKILAFFQSVIARIDLSIARNLREDGLYNAYNIVAFTPNGLEVSYLYPMLEGQVAVLSAEYLDDKQAVALLDAMRNSALYREDQRSYMLYPNRRRASFLEKNNLPDSVKSWPEYANLIRQGVLTEDCEGGVHFNAAYNNAGFIPDATDKLLNLYEETFRHREFTGRSGTFYKYEGLGCIYWHMVSKLLLAVGENIARHPGNKRLIEQYREIEAGIGAHKTPAEYGSFPFDPYSHTPLMAGVQQPGMTGQVKEDIISRWFYLGVQVVDGEIHICPTMLRREDFDADGHICFTYCGVPVTYTLGEKTSPAVIDRETARHIFSRDKQVKKLDITIALD